MADIFLSYATEDRDRIRYLVRALESDGWSVWWDRQIATGESFDRVIEQEIDAASCIVVAWSKDSVGKTWVRNEASEGLERNILTPVLIDDVKPPLAFRSVQAANLIGWPTTSHSTQLPQLLSAIRALISPEKTPLTDVERNRPKETSIGIVLAVLPLRDLTPERKLEYLCDGLAEDLMDAVFQIKGVRVVASHDTFAYRNSGKKAQEVGSSLKANMVLDGSVRQIGKGAVFVVRLLDLESGQALYSERFEHTLDDPVAVQFQMASQVLEGIREHLGVSDVSIEEVQYFQHPVAFAIKRQAASKDLSDVSRWLWGLKVIAALECALAINPQDERAYAELGQNYMRMQGVFGTEAVKPKLEALLAQLNRERPGSPAALSIEIELEHDMRALANRCKRSILRGEGVYAYAHPNGWPDIRVGLGHALAHSGLYREAYEYFGQIDRRGEPNRFNNLLHQLGCLIALGRFKEVLDLTQRLRQSAPDPGPLIPMWEFVAHMATEDFDSAARLLSHQEGTGLCDFHADAILEHRSGQATIPPSVTISDRDHNHETQAYALLSLGMIEEGFTMLEHQIEKDSETGVQHWIAHRLPIHKHLFVKEVIDHPRYREILRMLRLDQESRRLMQNEISELTPVTGIDTSDLLDL